MTDAARYGDLVVVFNPDSPAVHHQTYPDNIDELMPSMVSHAMRTLSRYDRDHDYLAITGAPLYVGLCMYVIGTRGRALRALRFDRLEKAYYPFIINPYGGANGEERTEGVG